MKNSKVEKYRIEDLKNSISDLQTIYTAILTIAENKNKIAIETLINSALNCSADIDRQITECGGVGFTSIDSTLDFIYDLENNK